MSENDLNDRHPNGENPTGTRRMVLTAIAFIVCFTLAVFAMRALTPGASLIVEANDTAAIVIKTGAVKIRQEDGSLVQKLTVGHQRVRAGKYRLENTMDGVQLEFSTGERFEIAKGEVLTLVISGEAEAP